MSLAENRVLIVDDEPGVRDYLSTAAQNLGFVAMAVETVSAFKKAMHDFPADILVMDLNMPGSDGVELLRFLGENGCRAQVLLISGEDNRVLTAAGRLGTQHGLHMIGTLQKPIRLKDLETALKRATEKVITKDALRHAIDTGELLLNYQPKLSNRGKGLWAVDAVEALVRWNHRQRGIIMPDSFIPLAAKSDLMSPLTDFVLREAIEQAGKWKEAGRTVVVGVNIPPDLLSDVGFPDRLETLLQQYGVDGSGLSLELTETAIVKDYKVSMDILTRLRIKRIGLSIDDFGTGYSSMKQLFQMPFSELKIDRSFVAELTRSDEATTMVNAMINLAHNLNMTVCAEGVESQAILDALEDAGCDKVQGFHIAKPLSAAEFLEFPTQWNSPS